MGAGIVLLAAGIIMLVFGVVPIVAGILIALGILGIILSSTAVAPWGRGRTVVVERDRVV